MIDALSTSARLTQSDVADGYAADDRFDERMGIWLQLFFNDCLRKQGECLAKYKPCGEARSGHEISTLMKYRFPPYKGSLAQMQNGLAEDNGRVTRDVSPPFRSSQITLCYTYGLLAGRDMPVSAQLFAFSTCANRYTKQTNPRILSIQANDCAALSCRAC